MTIDRFNFNFALLSSHLSFDSEVSPTEADIFTAMIGWHLLRLVLEGNGEYV